MCVQSAHKVDHHCLSLCGVIALSNGKTVGQKMKPKTLRSKHKKMRDVLFMDCCSKDGIVYIHTGHNKHRKIIILYLEMLIAVSLALGKAEETRKITSQITSNWCSTHLPRSKRIK